MKKKWYPQDNTKRKQIRFDEMLDEINEARGNMSLSAWVKQACREKLDCKEKN